MAKLCPTTFLHDPASEKRLFAKALKVMQQLWMFHFSCFRKFIMLLKVGKEVLAAVLGTLAALAAVSRQPDNLESRIARVIATNQSFPSQIWD